ncbi:MAG: hypothetical protein ACPIOQ_04435, partial [Promethearchaeia archaeon]
MGAVFNSRANPCKGVLTRRIIHDRLKYLVARLFVCLNSDCQNSAWCQRDVCGKGVNMEIPSQVERKR